MLVLINILLITLIVFVAYCIGYLGGDPKIMRKIKEGTATCTEASNIDITKEFNTTLNTNYFKIGNQDIKYLEFKNMCGSINGNIIDDTMKNYMKDNVEFIQINLDNSCISDASIMDAFSNINANYSSYEKNNMELFYQEPIIFYFLANKYYENKKDFISNVTYDEELDTYNLSEDALTIQQKINNLLSECHSCPTEPFVSLDSSNHGCICAAGKKTKNNDAMMICANIT